MARERFLCWERSSWHSTTMPVGMCVIRMAESVLIDVLSARPRGTEGVYAQIGRVQVDFFDFIEFR